METKRFTEAWHDLQLDAEDLIDLQNLIMADPIRNPVVAGTGGLRKVRFAAASMGQGKRGALRVCYVFFERLSAIMLVLLYRKNEKDDLLPAEKKLISKFLKTIEQELEKRLST